MQTPGTDTFASVAPRTPADLTPDRSQSRTVLLAAGAAIPQYTPMGRVTATGRWIPSVSTATDGSQVPRGILLVASGVRAVDAEGVIYTHGKFNRGLVPLGAWTQSALTEALFDAGIILEATV